MKPVLRLLVIGICILLMGCAASPVQSISRKFYAPCSGNFVITELAWLPDNTHIIYRNRTAANPTSLYLTDLSSKATTHITDMAQDAGALQWSPDVSLALFSRPVGLYLMDMANTSAALLTIPNDEHQYAWSPDSSMIAALTRIDGGYRIALVDPKDGKTIREIRLPQPVNLLSWSRDGQKLAVLMQGEVIHNQPHWNLNVYDLQTDSLTELLPDLVPQEQLTWSPDGSHLVFAGSIPAYGTLSEQQTVHLVASDGSQPVELAEQNVFIQHWSADSEHLIYIANHQIISVKADGSQRTVLAAAAGSLGSVSPDGQWYAYIDIPLPNTAHELMVTRIDGTQTIQVTHNPGNQMCFKWPF
jgi:Tol biopolymer transport system component